MIIQDTNLGLMSFVVLLSSCMYWLCMAEGLAMSRLQILIEFFFKSAEISSYNYL